MALIKKTGSKNLMHGNRNGNDHYELVTSIEFCSQGETGKLETRRYRLEQADGTTKDYLPDYWTSERTDNSNRVNRSWMPKEYLGKLGKNFKWDRYPTIPSVTRNLANEFVTQYETMFVPQHRGLYIYSAKKGSGKTLLACCLGNEIATRYGHNIKFITEADYLDNVKNDEFKKTIKECDLLIFDDFGISEQKPWIVNALYGLFNYRNSNMCSTIVTSNVPYDNQKVEDRIMSRVQALCLEMQLPDFSVRDSMRKESDQKFKENLKKNRAAEDIFSDNGE